MDEAVATDEVSAYIARCLMARTQAYLADGSLISLDRSEVPETFNELERIAQRNGIEKPEILVFNQDNMPLELRFAGTPIACFPQTPYVFVYDDCLQYFKNNNQQVELAHIITHEMAHRLTDPNLKEPNKTNEYLTDRVAAALIGDSKAYQRSLSLLYEYMLDAENKAIEHLKNSGELSEQELKDLPATVEETRQKARAIYGTHTERLANIQYDIDRRAKDGQER